MKRILIFYNISLIIGILIGGCTTNEFNDVQQAIEKQIQSAKVKTQFKLKLGSILLFPVKVITKLVDNEERASQYLNEIYDVQVGIYKIEKISENSDLIIPNTVEKVLNESGWELFIHVNEEKDKSFEIYYREHSADISSIFAVVIEGDDLIITEVGGRLDKIIIKAFKEHGLPLRQMF